MINLIPQSQYGLSEEAKNLLLGNKSNDLTSSLPQNQMNSIMENLIASKYADMTKKMFSRNYTYGEPTTEVNYPTALPQKSELEIFLSRLGGVESNNDYTSINKRSGAYGKYQFLPSTLREYAEKTGQTIEEAKTPEGQDKMFAKFTEDNVEALNRRGIEPTALNLWVAHNQGMRGLDAIYGITNMTDRIQRNIASNVPTDRNGNPLFDPTPENYLNYWSTKFSE